MRNWRVIHVIGPTNGLVTFGIQSPQDNLFTASTTDGFEFTITPARGTKVSPTDRIWIRKAVTQYIFDRLPRQPVRQL